MNYQKSNFCNQDFLGLLAAESFLKRQTIRERVKIAACWFGGFVFGLLFVYVF